jgi:hypothetical protein
MPHLDVFVLSAFGRDIIVDSKRPLHSATAKRVYSHLKISSQKSASQLVNSKTADTRALVIWQRWD